MTPVFLESPYAGDVARNVRYARACVLRCLERGEAPMATHLLYTQPGVLDDGDPGERALGLISGDAWREISHRVVVYTDLGISQGMSHGIGLLQWAGTRRVLSADDGSDVPGGVGAVMRPRAICNPQSINHTVFLAKCHESTMMVAAEREDWGWASDERTKMEQHWVKALSRMLQWAGNGRHLGRG